MELRFDITGRFPIYIKRLETFYKAWLGVEVEWDGKGAYAEFNYEGIRFAVYARRELPKLLGRLPDFMRETNGTLELAIAPPHFEDVDPEYQRALSLGVSAVYEPRMEP
jgi:lactoylglutathione lyase